MVVILVGIWPVLVLGAQVRMSGGPQGTDYRAAAVQPDGTAVAGAAAGLELVRQRNTSGQQRFPDYAAYLRYQRGRVEVQRRAALRARIASGSDTPPPAIIPDTPTILSATPSDGQVEIAFTPPTSDGGSTILFYTVKTIGRTDVSGAGSPIAVTGLTNGTTYTFSVSATNAVGESAASATTTATPLTVPDAPTGVSATAGNTQATVSFTAPVSNGGAAITGYTVTSNPGGFTATGSSSPLTVTGLTNGTAYTFTVVATNSVGDSTPSAASSAVTPSSVTRQVFTSGSGTWTAPAGVTSVEYLVVGGGGGGGAGSGTGAGSGGGGGSVKTGTLVVTPGSAYSYTVGGGGLGGTAPPGGETDGISGEASILDTITANGGGNGFRSRATNETGLYGRGGAAQSGDTPPTGGSGGNVRDGGGGNPDEGAGGGGGGAGGPGAASSSNGTDNNRGGAGGSGIFSTLQDDINREYGKGGKGADEGTSAFIGTRPGANGAANTGAGGGGGASHNMGNNEAVGGAGGSGIIVIKYTLP
jgi:hypothetical protein